MPTQVAVVIGSLRKDSLNRKMANALAAMAPAPLVLKEAPIRDLPMYDADLESDSPPQAWQVFRQQIKAADAVLFVTPEYNRSVPGCLKNAIDVGSRPYGDNAWQGKPAAVISVSPGAMGGFGANHHLRQSLMCLDMYTLQQPEAYIGNGAKLFAEDGSIAMPDTRAFMEKFLAAFASWIERSVKR